MAQNQMIGEAEKETALRVAREELQVVEGEAERLREEVAELRRALNKAEVILYGRSARSPLTSVTERDKHTRPVSRGREQGDDLLAKRSPVTPSHRLNGQGSSTANGSAHSHSHGKLAEVSPESPYLTRARSAGRRLDASKR